MYEVITNQSFKELDVNHSLFKFQLEKYDNFREWFKKRQDSNDKVIAMYRPGENKTLIGVLAFKVESVYETHVEPPFNRTSFILMKIRLFNVEDDMNHLRKTLLESLEDICKKHRIVHIYITFFDCEENENLKEFLIKQNFTRHGKKIGTDEEVYYKFISIYEEKK